MHRKHAVEMRGMERWVVGGEGGEGGWEGGKGGREGKVVNITKIPGNDSNTAIAVQHCLHNCTTVCMVTLHGPDLLHFRAAADLTWMLYVHLSSSSKYTGSVSAGTLIIFAPPFLVHRQCVCRYPHHLCSSIPCTQAVCLSVPSSSFLLHSLYTGSVSAGTLIIFSPPFLVHRQCVCQYPHHLFSSIPCTQAVCLSVPSSSFLLHSLYTGSVSAGTLIIFAPPFLVHRQCVCRYPHHLFSSIPCTQAVCLPVPSSSLLLHSLYTGSVSAGTLIIFSPPFLVHRQCVCRYPHHLCSSIPCTQAVCLSVPSSSFLLHSLYTGSVSAGTLIIFSPPFLVHRQCVCQYPHLFSSITQAQQASTSAPSRGSQPGRETDVKEDQRLPPSCEDQQVCSQDLAGWLGVQLDAWI